MGHPVSWGFELFAAVSAAWAPGSTTPMTGMGRDWRMSSKARAVAVLQAMTRSSAPCSWRKLGAGDGVAGDGVVGFGAVGETGGVAEVNVVGVRNEREEGAEDGEAAEA